MKRSGHWVAPALALTVLLLAAGLAAGATKPHAAPRVRLGPATGDLTDTTDAEGYALSDGIAYLSWQAPWGSPRAVSELAPHGDQPHPDTLWLTVDLVDDARHLYGFDANIVFHAAAGDTLGKFWRFGGGEANPHNVHVDFPVRAWPTEDPFGSQIYGASHYEFTPQAGTLSLTFATNADSARWVRGHRRIALARVILPATWESEMSRHPVCIDWDTAFLAVSLYGRNRHATAPGGVRQASWASRDGAVCGRFRDARRPRPWGPSGVSPGMGR